MFTLKLEMTVTSVILRFKSKNPNHKKMTTTTNLFRTVLLAITIFSASFTSVYAVNTMIAPGSPVAVTPLERSSNIFSFEAQTNDRTVNLDWMTIADGGSFHFEVERSFDNIHFKTVALVLDGFSANSDQKTYKFKENKITLNGQPVAYYRLKQVEANGGLKYSATVEVNLFNNTNGAVNSARE